MSCRRAGRPGLSSCASGCLASQSISALTSRPSASGESTVDRAAGVAEPARVPGQHVEAGLAQRPDADVAGRLVDRGVRVGLARAAPAVGLEDRRRLLAGLEAGGGVEGDLTIWVPSKRGDGRRRGRGGAARRSRAAARPQARRPGGVTRPWLHGAVRRCAGSAAIAGERDRHAVLQRVRRLGADAVHQERERDAARRRACAVARERGDVVQRAGLGVAASAGRRAAHAVGERAVAAGDGERDPSNGSATSVSSMPGQQPDDVARRGAVLAARGRSRRPSSGAMPKSAALRRATAAPAAVVPAPPKSRARGP